MSYLEVYVMPVVAARLDEYRAASTQSAALWLEFGALAVTEAVADNLSPGTVTSFPRSVALQEGETVVCAHLLYRDKAHRDEVVAAVFADPRMGALMENIPVDGARMFWSGFDVIVQV